MSYEELNIEGMSLQGSLLGEKVPNKPESTPPVANLGIMGMVGVGFFWVSGGPYGNEELVNAAPAGVVLFTLLILPIVYSLPVSLVSAEMATAIPEDGGPIVWVTRGFGFTLGMQHAWWNLATWVVDSSVYPVLAGEYALEGTSVCANEDSHKCFVYKGLIGMSVVVFVTLIKLMGLDIIVRFSTLLAVISLIPMIIFCFWGLVRLDLKTTNRWVNMEGDIDWSLLISWILWLNAGFFGIGALAGQVRAPASRTFTVSTAILIVVATVVAVLPLIISLSIDGDRTNYSAGYFGTLAGKLAGPWLAYFFQFAACASCIGLYNAQMIQSEVTLDYMCEQLTPNWYSRHRRRDGGLPCFVPVSCAVAVLALVWFPMGILVECSMLLSSLSMMFTLLVFFALRIKEPHLPRPFTVYGNTTFHVLLLITPILLTIAAVVCNLLPSSEGLVIRTASFFGVIAIGVIAQLLGVCKREEEVDALGDVDNTYAILEGNSVN